MDQTLVAGTNFNRLQPARAIDRSAEDKIPISVRSARRQGVWLLRSSDDVRLAELPAFGELRLVRKILGISFCGALVDPGLQAGDLLGGQAQVIGEREIAGVRKPRRHDARLRDRGDLACMRL